MIPGLTHQPSMRECSPQPIWDLHPVVTTKLKKITIEGRHWHDKKHAAHLGIHNNERLFSHNVVFYIFLKVFLYSIWQYNMNIVRKTINFLCQVLLCITTLLSLNNQKTLLFILPAICGLTSCVVSSFECVLCTQIQKSCQRRSCQISKTAKWKRTT